MTISAIQPAFTALQKVSQKPSGVAFAGQRLISAPPIPSWDAKSHDMVARNFPRHQTPSLNTMFHQKRREALLSMLPANTTVVVTGNRLYGRNYDVDYQYRQDSNFYYLTGFDEPDAVAVLSNVPGKPRFTMFVQPANPWRETWDGERAGVTGAKNTYKANAAYGIDELAQRLPDVLKNSKRLMWAPSEFNTELNNQVQKLMRVANTGPAIRNVAADIHHLRTIKTTYEIALMKRACEISAQGHLAIMREAKNLLDDQGKLNEGRIQALTEYYFRDGGAERVGYPTIAPGGARTCTLHYNTNRKDAKAGDLVLLDGGAEYNYYTADITRTWPVSGKYTPEQKAIYDVVLDAQESSIQMVKPGATLKDIHANAVRKVTEGLVGLGILQGDVDQLIKDGAYFKYFMHGTSHMMGMDVHDVNLTSQQGLSAKVRNTAKQVKPAVTKSLIDLGVLKGDPEKLIADKEYFKYYVQGGDALGVDETHQAELNKNFAQLASTRGHATVPLQPGMIFSVEPGIYVPKDDTSVDPKWRGIGVRIEDDILVTPEGYDNLSGMIPRTTEEIEALMAQSQPETPAPAVTVEDTQEPKGLRLPGWQPGDPELFP